MLKKLLTKNNIIKRLAFVFLFTIVNTKPAVSFELKDISFDVERRKPQFGNEYSYLIIPIPYRIPGIGEGLGIGAALHNIKESYTDLYGVAIQGDVAGYGLGINDFHIIPKHLIFDFGYSEINKASFFINYSRGMEGDEDPDEFNLAEVSNSKNYGGRLTLTFDERKYELQLTRYHHISQVDRIRDPDGNILIEIDNPEEFGGTTTGLSAIADLTDDRHDPRKGFSINVLSGLPHDPREGEVNYYTVDINTTAYFPILSYSTLVFNLFKSDAYVLQKGETDRDKIAEKYDVGICSPGDTKCEEARDFYIDKIYAQNTYGSASSLGGLSRLRSFPIMRYRGAHTRFFGTEFRWNLTDEITPFNIWFLKDIRTAFQIAFFYEIGSAADHEGDLFKETRHSKGVGLRAVMDSGMVFRVDVATGEEGSEFVIFFSYPWTFL